MMAKKAPNPIDKHVGSRVRMRRMMLSMSQEKLGNSLGLTFQQVQKYEKGTNRVGASRLVQIADVLKVPITSLFAGVDRHATKDTKSPQELLADTAALKLLKGFGDISDRSLRSALVHLVTHIAQKGR